MKIEVTREHIDRGNRGDRFMGAVSISISERLPEFWTAEVDCEVIEIFNVAGILVMRLSTPASVRKFLRSFDKGNTGNPFSFRLPIDEFCKAA